MGLDQSIKINVDTSQLDETTEKANRLLELLREASNIIDSLSGVKESVSAPEIYVPCADRVTKVE